MFFITSTAEAKDAESLRQLSDVFSQISEKVNPSVVSVVATQKIKISSRSTSPFFEDPFFDDLRRFFGPEMFPTPQQPREREYEHSGLGSGLIITSDGYILTNNHVVAKADEIEVILSDDRKFDAEITGTDPETDLAVIKINAKNLPAAKLGDSDKVKVGDWVVAIGNPFGLQHTVTAGIISAVGRSNVGITEYEDFIQTDAAINPGNSGGPLVNLDGEIIGINTAIFSNRGTYMGVGLAIPINMAEKITPQLIEKGKVTRGWLGVTIQNLSEELAENLGLEQTKGVVVRQVQIDSPADKAGIKSNDIIVEIDGKQIETTKQLMQNIATLAPGTETELVILRDNKKFSKVVEIAERPSSNQLAKVEDLQGTEKNFGIEVKELTNELAEQYNLKGREGVVITRITPGSVADIAELQEGDLIVGIDRYTIRNIQDYRKAIEKVQGTRNVIEFQCIRYYRGRHWRFTTRLKLN